MEHLIHTGLSGEENKKDLQLKVRQRRKVQVSCRTYIFNNDAKQAQ